MQLPEDVVRAPIDRTAASQAGGSIGHVLLLALVLLAAGCGLFLIGRAQVEPYILAILAILAMAGVFLLFALAAGILRPPGRAAASALPKAVVDGAGDGILVTDAKGRVVYANAAYLALVAAGEGEDARPVERVFIGDPGVSESVYRLLKAAREGRRGQEEVRLGAHKGEEGRWLRIRVRPLGSGKRESRMTVWSLADVTRELERHENVFQELQHAIDYLDHAPAGFFAADGGGNIVYLNATLASWLDHDLAQVGSGGLKLDNIVAGEGAALLTTLAAMPGDVKTEIFDIDLKTRGGRTLPVRLFHKVAFGADGTPGTSRTLVLNRAHDDGSDPQRAAEVRFMRFFQNTPMAIATVDRGGGIADSNARFAHLFHSAFKIEASADRSILTVVAERDRGALEAAIRKAADGQGEIAPVDAALVGKGERYATFFVIAIEDQAERDREAAIVYALETTQQRTLENQVNQQQKMETIGRLAGNIAHDFNNLLGAIMMATDFLLNAHRPTDP
ncbi:MAG TPA: PAS domain-containing protein, partial [Pseudomonadota bacterium]|nr:PAS domain-containing protein [Pseudomonadota bacterium]